MKGQKEWVGRQPPRPIASYCHRRQMKAGYCCTIVVGENWLHQPARCLTFGSTASPYTKRQLLRHAKLFAPVERPPSIAGRVPGVVRRRCNCSAAASGTRWKSCRWRAAVSSRWNGRELSPAVAERGSLGAEQSVRKNGSDREECRDKCQAGQFYLQELAVRMLGQAWRSVMDQRICSFFLGGGS